MKEKFERTLVILKPDALQRNLLGEIIRRFEHKGLQVVGLKMIQMGDILIDEHYAHHKDKPFFNSLKNFMKSAPAIVMVLSGINAISAVRLLVGPTRGHEADAGSIRGDFSLSGQSNIVHASDSKDTAEAEIKRFFTADELFDYSKPAELYIYADEGFK
ncbi:MAG: nucleoside-diphosphate kinase [Candidatus Vogelbacteria bacterium RIFOXYD1_FULL_44_32]|uniref:Nucleoside diphosphate kinase n=1 Tax=Candidatus Vogelbacteria bacterium RIFOXYD1_FULL_44_32 TaxID=1802438 RepID=A0A1G2QDZ8_9BACT|nr:MAG: nucleoside-diphosphate kinase [Candidatus Vogelbacteria bacterium RIFOXYD1_FULL_44_32]